MMTNKTLIYALIMIGTLISFSSIIPSKAQTFAPHTQQKQPEARELFDNFTGRLFLLSRKKNPGGGRGDICAISPQTWVESDEQVTLEPVKLLNPQPLFLWTTNDSTVTAIEVFEDSEEAKDPIWRADIPDGKTHMIYQGTPLKPGKVYYWRLQAIGAKKQTYFKVIPEQDLIQQKLKQREQELLRQGASVEKISLEKANDLAEKGFESDALRELFSVANPSPELKQTIQKILAHNFCGD